MKRSRLLVLNVNGRDHEVAAAEHHTLCEVLRYQLDLTGTKQGCDKGDCGACTVLVAEGLVGADAAAPVLSCITLACASEGKRVTTIEGLARDGKLSPVQDAFDRCGALQCGFCQPGMMMSAHALLQETPKPTVAQIKEALAGNLCRCTGYSKILEACLLAAATGASPPTSADIEAAYVKMRAEGLATRSAP